MGVTPSENFWIMWRPSHFVVKIFFSGIFEVWRASQPVTGVTTCDGRHTPSDRRHTLITKINQSNEKYYCMTGDMPFEVFQWSMNGWIKWTWDWRLSELFRLQVIFFFILLKTILHQQQHLCQLMPIDIKLKHLKLWTLFTIQ